jgi:hypothetical protein
MGWWSQDLEGHSFAENSDLIWGDCPADAIGDALDVVLQCFAEEVGRKPTPQEIRAGLEFSLRALDLEDQ